MSVSIAPEALKSALLGAIGQKIRAAKNGFKSP
jgi:hypothetical protein